MAASCRARPPSGRASRSAGSPSARPSSCSGPTDWSSPGKGSVGWWPVIRFPQSLDALVSIERHLSDTGRTSRREITDFGFVDAPPGPAQSLGSRVLEVGRVNLVDGQPFARVVVWCREDLGAELSRADVARSSFYDLLPTRPGRAVQTIGAEAVREPDADLLGVPVDSPVLVVRRTTFDTDDRAMLVSEHRFPGHLTEFVAELAPSPADWPAADGPDGPGLRLVDQA